MLPDNSTIFFKNIKKYPKFKIKRMLFFSKVQRISGAEMNVKE